VGGEAGQARLRGQGGLGGGQGGRGLKRKLVPFEVTGRGIARHGYPIAKEGQTVGTVTSGTMGPSVDKAIGLGYVPAALSAVGSTFDVIIRDKPVAAVVVERPFLKK
jgi:aminomethyltransferase